MPLDYMCGASVREIVIYFCFEMDTTSERT